MMEMRAAGMALWAAQQDFRVCIIEGQSYGCLSLLLSSLEHKHNETAVCSELDLS